jgi:hypothetical protein
MTRLARFATDEAVLFLTDGRIFLVSKRDVIPPGIELCIAGSGFTTDHCVTRVYPKLVKGGVVMRKDGTRVDLTAQLEKAEEVQPPGQPVAVYDDLKNPEDEDEDFSETVAVVETPTEVPEVCDGIPLAEAELPTPTAFLNRKKSGKKR